MSKTFTYQECVNFSKGKNKIIKAYDQRFHALWKYLRECKHLNKELSPEGVINQMSIIEEKFPIIIGDLKE